VAQSAEGIIICQYPELTRLHSHPTGFGRKKVGDLMKTCHTAGHEKTGRGQNLWVNDLKMAA
jgi:hypothetical protein